MHILGFLIVLLYCSFVCAINNAVDPCISHSPCQCVFSNNTVIDLSSVGSPEFVRFYDILFDNKNCSTTNLFSYNPCYPFDSPDRQAITESTNTVCSGASACVKTPGGNDGKFPEVHAIGLQKNANFSLSDNQLSINYIVPKSNRILQVNLICSKSSDDSHLLNLESPKCPTEGESKIVFTLTSKCACPDGCKAVNPTPSPSSSSVLSTGSKLLIAFFTILIAYVLIGIVWNYCNGAHGLQLIPNVEFWNELPTLIMEGVAFTCSCCGKTNSYGEV